MGANAVLLQPSVLAILLSYHGFSPHPAQSLRPLGVTLPPHYLLLSLSFLAPSCISSSSPPGMQTQSSVFPVFFLFQVLCTYWRHNLEECHWHSQLPCTSFPDICLAHPVTYPDATSATAPPLWMPFLLHHFSLTQLQRHAAKQLVGFFLLCL